MRIGIHLPQIGQLAGPTAIRQAAVAAEQAGYSSLWVLDRVLAPVAPRSRYPALADGVLPEEHRTVLDPIGVLTLAASVTERVRVGTSVLVGPWYAPLLLARSLATLDLISDGRLDVGLGLGWSTDEYEAVGVAQRHLGDRLEELLDVLAAAWGSDPVSHTGTRIRVVPSHIGAKPAQPGGPPLLLAAFTPAGLDRVARRADGWNPAGLPVHALGPMWRAIRELAAAHRRDVDRLRLVVRANIRLTDRPLGTERPSYHGSLEQVAEDLDATRRVGADEIILGCYGDPETLEVALEQYAAMVAAANLTVSV